MLTRKLLYIGRRKLNLATYLATQRSFSATCLPQMTLRCKPMSTMRGHNSQRHSSQQSRLQHEIGRSHSTHSHLLDDVGEDLLEDEKEEVTKLTSRFLHTGGMAHQVDHLMFFVILCHLQVLVLLPYVKSGAEKKLETNSSLMLAEAEALVRTLEWKVQLQQNILSSTHVCAPIRSSTMWAPLSSWLFPQVVDSVAVGLSSFKKKYLFGTGNLEKLRGIVLGNERITAVRIGSGR